MFEILGDGGGARILSFEAGRRLFYASCSLIEGARNR
jgi:hypothetical protein